MRRLAMHTTTISSFGERHSAHHWCAGFNEAHNVGGCGMERAEEITTLALDWLRRIRRAAWADRFPDQPAVATR